MVKDRYINFVSEATMLKKRGIKFDRARNGGENEYAKNEEMFSARKKEREKGDTDTIIYPRTHSLFSFIWLRF